MKPIKSKRKPPFLRFRYEKKTKQFELYLNAKSTWRSRIGFLVLFNNEY